MRGPNNLIIGQGGHGDATAAATPWPVIAVVVGAIVALAAVMMMKRDDPRSSLERRFAGHPKSLASRVGSWRSADRETAAVFLPTALGAVHPTYRVGVQGLRWLKMP